MGAFDPRTVRKWVHGLKTADRLAPPVMPPDQAIALSVSLIEDTWPLADDEFNRRRREQDAEPVRALWVKLARATGSLPPPSPKRSRV